MTISQQRQRAHEANGGDRYQVERLSRHTGQGIEWPHECFSVTDRRTSERYAKHFVVVRKGRAFCLDHDFDTMDCPAESAVLAFLQGEAR